MLIFGQPIHHINFDINLLGSCDVVVAELCRRAGWSLDHEMIPKDQNIEVLLANEMHDNIFYVKCHD
jgi:NAD-dependent histone deacetylase SIR2